MVVQKGNKDHFWSRIMRYFQKQFGLSSSNAMIDKERGNQAEKENSLGDVKML